MTLEPNEGCLKVDLCRSFAISENEGTLKSKDGEDWLALSGQCLSRNCAFNPQARERQAEEARMVVAEAGRALEEANFVSSSEH